jgi:glutathione reductase (NADPH)
MEQVFDLVVIGTGSAASAVASRCRAAGWQVAILDSRPFGGTCALRGCDPKKVLLGAAEVVDWARRMQGNGIQPGDLHIDWPELMRFKRSFTEPVPANREQEFAKSGIVPFHGRAHFIGTSILQVGDHTLKGRNVVIATGQQPADLKIPGMEYLTTSEQFLELDALPKRVLFVGGGYIAFEFAHVVARTGAHATIVHRGPRPLSRFDPDLVDRLVERTRELGVDVQLGAEVVEVEKTSGHFVVHTSVAGQDRTLAQRNTFEADMVVHAAGRVPEIDDLDLGVAGIEREQRGVKVNEFLQSVSNPAVYAAGDAVASGGPPLTPVASYDGLIVAANLLKGNHKRPNYVGIPTTVFTIPQLASVGLGEREASEQGLKFRVNKQMTSNWYSSRRVGEKYSGFKVLVEEGKDRVLGAHLLGGEAAEIINFFALAIRSGLPATELRHMIFTYPTQSSNIPYMI